VPAPVHDPSVDTLSAGHDPADRARARLTEGSGHPTEDTRPVSRTARGV